MTRFAPPLLELFVANACVCIPDAWSRSSKGLAQFGRKSLSPPPKKKMKQSRFKQVTWMWWCNHETAIQFKNSNTNAVQVWKCIYNFLLCKWSEAGRGGCWKDPLLNPRAYISASSKIGLTEVHLFQQTFLFISLFHTLYFAILPTNNRSQMTNPYTFQIASMMSCKYCHFMLPWILKTTPVI